MAKEMDCQWNEGNSVNQADVGPMISKIGPDFITECIRTWMQFLLRSVRELLVVCGRPSA